MVPAVCEELAFRGFILSGFRHLGHKWRAIVYSALLFGLTHGILQQSLIACLLGTVLGFLAVQSGSILPGMVFHVVHNTLAVANSRITPDMIPNSPLLRKLVTPADGGGCAFEWPLVVVGSLVRRAVADVVRPAAVPEIAGRRAGRSHRTRRARSRCRLCPTRPLVTLIVG